jgi:ankyrin repeat protein
MNDSNFLSLLLLDPTIDFSPYDNNRRKPLHRAVIYGKLEVLKTLIADPRINPWVKT